MPNKHEMEHNPYWCGLNFDFGTMKIGDVATSNLVDTKWDFGQIEDKVRDVKTRVSLKKISTSFREVSYLLSETQVKDDSGKFVTWSDFIKSKQKA